MERPFHKGQLQQFLKTYKPAKVHRLLLGKSEKACEHLPLGFPALDVPIQFPRPKGQGVLIRSGLRYLDLRRFTNSFQDFDRAVQADRRLL